MSTLPAKRETAAALTSSEALGALRTEKQRRFCRYYVGKARFNATEAARLAGYKGDDNTVNSIGAENLAKPGIAAAIRALIAERAMPEDQALAMLSEHAMASPEDLLRIEEDDDGNAVAHIDLATAKERGILHLVRKIKQGPHGLEVELHDAQAALKELLRHYDRLRRGQREEEAVRSGTHVLERMGINVQINNNYG